MKQTYMQRWRTVNKKRIKEYNREYCRSNRERINIVSLKYQKLRPDETLLLQKVSSANRRYPGKISLVDLKEVIEKCGRKCYWCKKSNLKARQFTLEHLKPVNKKKYLVIACLSCNAAKLHLTGGKRKTKEEKKAMQHENWLRWYKKKKLKKK